MELKKILYVDDESDVREIVMLSLETLGGFEIKAFSNGEEALAAVEAFAPDLLMLDVMMPGITGPELLAKMRELPSIVETPAVFITAKAQVHEVDKLKLHKRSEVIAKPFEVMELPDTVRAAWKRILGDAAPTG